MLNNFSNEQNFRNPMFNMVPQQMGSPITEQEIQNQKNKLNNLRNQLINTHNINEEISINNEMKKETEFLSSLIKIKRNELNQNNNNMNIDPMQQQIMQQQMMQQQMMQQQMMQQQMMAQARQECLQKAMEDILNNSENTSQSSISVTSQSSISVIFRAFGATGQAAAPIVVQCKPDEKVYSIIQKYRDITNDRDPTKKFMCGFHNLYPSLTAAESGIGNNANIFVVSTKPIKEEK